MSSTTIIEKGKLQKEILKSLIDENVAGENDEIIEEIKNQLRNQQLFNIGEIEKTKKKKQKTLPNM